MEHGMEHPSLRREAIPDEACDGLLPGIFLRFANVWTGRGPRAGIGQAAVVLKQVRACSGLVLNICAD
ncbi:MAG: hypothetical protein DMG39_02080 [Acidobacteria bacterium]|nr:MAG: hypothetical protein DMG39_02080 [Acidobacteriota bacterium]